MELRSVIKKKINLFKFKIFNIIVAILQLSNIILEECSEEFPFLRNGIYANDCGEDVYNLNECGINNSIIKRNRQTLST